MASGGPVSHCLARTPHAPGRATHQERRAKLLVGKALQVTSTRRAGVGHADLWNLICIPDRRLKILEPLSPPPLHPANHPNSNTEAEVQGESLLLTTNANQW